MHFFFYWHENDVQCVLAFGVCHYNVLSKYDKLGTFLHVFVANVILILFRSQYLIHFRSRASLCMIYVRSSRDHLEIFFYFHLGRTLHTTMPIIL